MSNNPQKPLQRVVVIVSGLALLGVMTVPLFRSMDQSSSSSVTSTTNSLQQEKLQAIATGYEQVLKREPENPTALQGLVEARLQLNDLEGAIEPMEKLVELFPQEERLATILETMKQELEMQNNPSPPPSSDENQEQP